MSDKLTRREWGSMAFAGFAGMLLLACKTNSNIPLSIRGTTAEAQAKELGVVLGVQSYSFRDRSLDEAIAAMKLLGIKSCELWQDHIEPDHPKDMKPAEWTATLRKWRDNVTMEDIKAVKAKFENAGIVIQAYNGTLRDDISDHDIDLTFNIAKALGADGITTSSNIGILKRLDGFAQKHKMIVAIHNHSHVERPLEFSTPENFSRAMQGLSNYIRINLDIGHFTAANFDAVDFMKKNHEKILCIHVKDRLKDQGKATPFGQGDAPIAAVLHLIRDNKWPIAANIEYEFKADGTVEDVKKCLAYCKQALKT